MMYLFLGILVVAHATAWLLILKIKKIVDQQNIAECLKKIEAVREELSLKQVAVKEEFQKEIQRIQEYIQLLESSSKRNREIVKTVVQGFDFIVQGCKSALDHSDKNSTSIITNAGNETKNILDTIHQNIQDNKLEIIHINPINPNNK